MNRQLHLTALLAILAVMWSMLYPATASTKVAVSPPQIVDAIELSGCEDAESWLESSAERNARVAELNAQIFAVLQAGLPFDADHLRSLAAELRVLASEQRASKPSDDALALNILLADRMMAYADGAERLADGDLTGADRLDEGSEIGQSLPSMIDEFKKGCGLAESSVFSFQTCQSDRFREWYLGTSGRILRVEELVANVTSEPSDSTRLQQAIDEIQQLEQVQQAAERPQEANNFNSLVLELWDIYLQALEALQQGRYEEVERLADQAIQIGDSIREEDVRLHQECSSNTPEQSSETTPEVGSSTRSANDNNIPMFRSDAQHSGVQPGPMPRNGNRIVWKFDVGGPIYSSPALVDGVLYFGAADGMYSVGTSSGNLRWRFTSSAVRSSPAVVGGKVFFGSADHNFYALDAGTGREIWTYQSGGLIDSSPVVANGLVFFNADDGFLHALDAETGKEQWRFATGGGVSSPAVADGTVYVGSFVWIGQSNDLSDGYLYALDAATGKERWRFRANEAVQSSPVVSDERVYVGSDDGFLYALDRQTGEERWSRRLGGVYCTPTLVAGVIYVGAENSVFAVEAQNGNVLWKFDTGYSVNASPAVVDDVVLVASGDHRAYALDGRTGTELWQFDAGGAIYASPVVVSGVAYIGTIDGFMFAVTEG